MRPNDLNEHELRTGPSNVHELIARRWSTRAFDPRKPVTRDELLSLVEAASWAPSSHCDQPWRYVICDRFSDESAWNNALACMNEKNRRWARNAPLLMLAVACERFRGTGEPNRWGQYDTGAASENLSLQATALGLATRQIGGFDTAQARAAFDIPDGFEPMAMIALGHQAGPDTVHADFIEAESGPRKRGPLGERFFTGGWNRPLE